MAHFKKYHSKTVNVHFLTVGSYDFACIQKYIRLRCLVRVKGLVITFYLGWSGSILQFSQNIIKVGSKSWLLTCSSNITLSLPSYTGSALKRELNFCNGYLSLLYFCTLLSAKSTGKETGKAHLCAVYEGNAI